MKLTYTFILSSCHVMKRKNLMEKLSVLSLKQCSLKIPNNLLLMHKQIRKELKNKGYDIEQENKPIEEFLAYYVDKNGKYTLK